MVFLAESAAHTNCLRERKFAVSFVVFILFCSFITFILFMFMFSIFVAWMLFLAPMPGNAKGTLPGTVHTHGVIRSWPDRRSNRQCKERGRPAQQRRRSGRAPFR